MTGRKLQMRTLLCIACFIANCADCTGNDVSATLKDGTTTRPIARLHSIHRRPRRTTSALDVLSLTQRRDRPVRLREKDDELAPTHRKKSLGRSTQNRSDRYRGKASKSSNNCESGKGRARGNGSSSSRDRGCSERSGKAMRGKGRKSGKGMMRKKGKGKGKGRREYRPTAAPSTPTPVTPPTTAPSLVVPTPEPTRKITLRPSIARTIPPSMIVSDTPTMIPSVLLVAATNAPITGRPITLDPTSRPTVAPSQAPVKLPITAAPVTATPTTTRPTTSTPTLPPTTIHTAPPTQQTLAPTFNATFAPTSVPNKSSVPTVQTTSPPTKKVPTATPSVAITSAPVAPTVRPSTTGTIPPTLLPVTTTTTMPTISPTTSNTISPTLRSTGSPTTSTPARIVPITPFQLVLVGATQLSSDDDYNTLHDLILQYLANFMKKQFSFNLDFDFTGQVTGDLIAADGNVVTLDLDAVFAETSRLIPTPDGIDILTRTAFGNPFVNEFLLLLSTMGPPLDATTNVIYSSPPP